MSGLGAGGEADRVRLRAISRAADGPTLALLEPLLPTGARVADLGCGNASVSVALGERDTGARVFALDRDLSLLPDVLPANVVPVEADLRAWSPPECLDLVHARFVLAHLPDPAPAVTHLLGMLRPGGRVVVTEPYHLPAVPAELPGDEGAVARVLAAYRAVAECDGLSFALARRLPGLLAAVGAQDVQVDVRASRLGGGPGSDRWSSLVDRVRDRLDVPAGDLEAFDRYAAAPDTFAVPQLVVTVSARAARSPGDPTSPT